MKRFDEDAFKKVAMSTDAVVRVLTLISTEPILMTTTKTADGHI